MSNVRYQSAIADLDKTGKCSMKVFGQSMTPLIESGSLLTFHKTDNYKVGDVVFCRVGSRFIDAHKITKIASDGRFMIANNKGHENGWARQVYGRVTSVNGRPFGRPLE